MPAEIHISESHHNQGPAKRLLPNSGHRIVNYISTLCYKVSELFVFLISLVRIPKMPISLTTTYLLPAIFLNPAIVLHAFNTFVSRANPGELAASSSTHEWLENLGPADPSKPYLDMHSSDSLCWSYTVFMIIVQLLAFGKVSENRIQRKAARAAKKEQRELEKSNRIALEDEQDATETIKFDEQGVDGLYAANGRRRSAVSFHRVTESKVFATMNGKIAIQDIDDLSSETSTSDEETTT